ncbi:hypothetical protein EGR_00681 [Echinococcus granulosus]|uniref:Uncharacterized protein n=1 Tax=Echinococcus granulosus TaxID=6210 RepID=W6UVQ4_ECHGR|nr:hypothetical protein EGR_00681 [Echinococcus granulosus]EUB64731.1 hypothetical protein EGR_00681 [Echinococcus granulosus]
MAFSKNFDGALHYVTSLCERSGLPPHDLLCYETPVKNATGERAEPDPTQHNIAQHNTTLSGIEGSFPLPMSTEEKAGKKK